MMNYMKMVCCLVGAVVFSGTVPRASAQEKPAYGLDRKWIDDQLGHAQAQYKVLASRLPDGRLPRTYHKENDSLVTTTARNWVSGFYPGTLLYVYEATGDGALLAEAKKRLELLEGLKDYKGTHDLGFMLYCS